ncbi:NlpC/P60 family peptidoglycan-binding protein RipD [Mycolicibacterium fallax]|jgi:cell wall-associated NlpC family hydrolase|uniref:Hydrolase n=1 Tax=Mycolicibacterium fallax TaxID=1793 RepID=A0A1X1RDT7_MYCFA|nr:NlpC/P60 family peptidoglycan-binding protein RipD [Mycolicibacterium fallax]ORV03512.1 hydrolase [Mycolicibacterium fallax]BBY97427.1 hydrolase [Mycolicibacterium fallax]HSA39930.1 NlpC/P60 family peptidoglycan-binding protein RipD [Mycobacterium sp.]
MKRAYAVMLAAVMLFAVPGIASADIYRTPTNQQAVAVVVQRALSQRGVPFVYGGGDVNGPTLGVPRTPVATPAPGQLGAPQLGPGQAPAGALNPAPPATPAFGFPGLSAPTAPIPLAPTVPGFDASGLMVYSFAGAGLKLPRSSGEQYRVGQKVLPQQALPGDLLFYGPEGTQSVAMFLGNNQMIEVSESGVSVAAVRTKDMTPYLVRYIP